MNQNLQQLFNIANKPERLIIGLMSGTSLDGLDIALCRFSGSGLQTSFELLKFKTAGYSNSFKQEILQLFARRQIDQEKLCLMNALVGSLHAELIMDALKEWDIDPTIVDVIASHGQTIYHAPRRLHGKSDYPNATLQIGDADHIAVKTGIITLANFRQKHIAAGGEGAPLALYGDVILGSQPGENRILLNIGGIANLTWLPADGNGSNIVCTDIGPGNTLIDAACRKYFDKPFDEDSRIAFSGQVNQGLLDALLQHSFFAEAAPKTTGPELFNLEMVAQAQQQTGTEDIAPNNLIATLSALTVHSIAGFIKANFTNTQRILLSGGGARNLFVAQGLQQLFRNVSVGNTAELGIDPDAKEAILFALLANEALCGEPLYIGTNPAVLMGKISFAK